MSGISRPETESVRVENVFARLYNPPTVVDWDALTATEKCRVSESTDPVASAQARNTTTVDMHEWLVGRSDPNGQLPPDISDLALGTGDTAVAEGDDALTTEVDRVEITTSARENDSLRIKTFIDKGQANVDVQNGEALREVGLYAGSEYFLNHALLGNDLDKTNTKTATVDVLITYNAA